jgi:hypothetical protein
MNASQTEAMLAAEVVAWLETSGWDVYRSCRPGPGIADIVATLKPMLLEPDVGDGVRLTGFDDASLRSLTVDVPLVAVVQCKRELSFELLAQAEDWVPHAHIVWLAVQAAKRSPGRVMAKRLALKLGLGVLEVDGGAVEVVAKAPVRADSEVLETLRLSLRPEHKTHAAAGSQGGGQFTSWKGTCAALRAFVSANEGCTMVEAVRGIVHHYRSEKSAVSALSKWAHRGKIPGVVCGWKGRLWTSAEAAARGVTGLRLVQGRRS